MSVHMSAHMAMPMPAHMSAHTSTHTWRRLVCAVERAAFATVLLRVVDPVGAREVAWGNISVIACSYIVMDYVAMARGNVSVIAYSYIVMDYIAMARGNISATAG